MNTSLKALFATMAVTLGASQAWSVTKDNEIVIGTSAPASGNMAALSGLPRALEAYFKKVSEEKRLGKYKIKFVFLDDGFSPPRTVENVRKLVEQEKVDFLTGIVGAPTNAAVIEYVNQNKVPHLFIATGASMFFDVTKNPNTIMFLPSFHAEAKTYAKHVLDTVKDPKIALLYRDDAFGKDLAAGLKEGLGDKAKSVIVSEQTYQNTDPTVDSQMLKMKNSGANVFMNFTIGKAAVQSVKKAADLGWKPTQFLFSGSTSIDATLKPAGKNNAVGALSSGFAKSASDPQWKDDAGLKEFIEFQKKYLPSGSVNDDYVMYGYVIAQLVESVLKQAGDDLSRENIMKQALNLKGLELPILFPGIKVDTSPTDYMVFQQIRMIKFDGEKWLPFGNLYDVPNMTTTK